MAAARHAADVFSRPPTLGEALRQGLHAQSSALKFFQKQNVSAAMGALGDELLQAVGGFLPPSMKQTAEFVQFSQQWGAKLKDLQSDFRQNATAFVESGKSFLAVDMLSTGLFELSKVATAKLPRRTGAQVATYLASLIDSLEGAGEAVDIAEEGDQVQGLEAMVNGMKAAINGLIPRNLQIDSTYSEVMKTTDPEMGKIVTNLAAVMRDLVNARVCWKKTAMRAKTRPRSCAPGYSLLDDRWCTPDADGVGELQQAQCAVGAEAKGSWCYEPCPVGYEPKVKHCRQMCGGRFHVNSPMMCGDAQGMIALALVEIAAQTMMAVITREGLSELAQDAGLVLASSMTATMESFVDLAKPFGHPKCPELTL